MNPRTLPLLSFPTLLDPMRVSLATATAPAMSWIQLAKTGSFVSNRYGKFAITRQDLAQMLHNFQHVTPKAPTELPIDYDHLGMDPKHPGDGIAAGWLKELELRAEGEELWGRAEFTPKAAAMIRDQEYRFVSPSFVKDHTHKDGKKIGTTLLAAAVTCHPFLEGMSALTLYSKDVHGRLALSADMLPTLETDMNRPLHLAASDGSVVGTRVTFKADDESSPELSPEEKAGVYLIKAVKGEGDAAFVKLVSAEGEVAFGWYPASALAPAPASEETPSPLPKDTIEEPSTTALTTPPEGAPQGALDPRIHVPQNFNHGEPGPVTLSNAEEVDAYLFMRSNQIARDEGISLGAAAKKAGKEMTEMRTDWADLRRDIEREPDPEPVSLSDTMRAATSFVDLVNSVKASHQLSDWREAIAVASQARPDLAERHRDGL